tara:strand:- start:86 stop:331 length:246 start_codon:yes stop_codon:yes gene_type:complete
MISIKNITKHEFIKSFNLINPITAFQNQLNAVTKTDYYAYLGFRNNIQTIIDDKIGLILDDTWNNVIVDKNIYIGYVDKFK